MTRFDDISSDKAVEFGHRYGQHLIHKSKATSGALLSMFVLVVAACTGAGGSDVGEGAVGSTIGTPTPVIEPAFQLSQVPTLTIMVTTTAIGANTGWLARPHTCEGNDISPPLEWDGVPPATESLVLVFEDPASDELDGRGLWTHWVLFSIPPDVTSLEAAQPAAEALDIGAIHGTNDYGKAHYSGPCPVPNIWWGTETGRKDAVNTRSALVRSYIIRLYAVAIEVALDKSATREDVLREIDGHILAAGEAELPFKSRKRVTVLASCARDSLTVLQAAKCIE